MAIVFTSTLGTFLGNFEEIRQIEAARIFFHLFFFSLPLTLSKLVIISPSSLVELIFFIVLIINVLKTTKVIIPIMSCACIVTSTITQSTNN